MSISEKERTFSGLTDEEVSKSRESNGSNKIIEAEPETFWINSRMLLGLR